MLKSEDAEIKVLLFDASPVGPSTLVLDAEARAISEGVHASAHRDLIRIIPVGPVRPGDLLQEVMKHRPEVIHFSGHGRPEDGVLVYDRQGNARAIDGEALAALFESTRDTVRLVFLNACYSAPQAEAISSVVPWVIGMKGKIEEEAARLFATHFYQALGFGRSVQDAFNLGLVSLKLHGADQGDIPYLINGTGIGHGGPALITIVPEKADIYRAIARDKESTGRTAGEALDALTSQLADDEGGTLAIVQNHKADRFFNAAQQKRLTELMSRRDAGAVSAEEERELEGLIEAELDGARRRAESLLNELRP